VSKIEEQQQGIFKIDALYGVGYNIIGNRIFFRRIFFRLNGGKNELY